MAQDAASLYEEAYAALDAAMTANGSDRSLLVEKALGMWRLARYASGALTPQVPARRDDPDDSAPAS